MGSQQDSTIVMIPTQIGDMVIAALYSPPRSKELQEKLQDIIKKAPNYILGGDLNSKSPAWGCNEYNKDGKVLENMQEQYRFTVAAPNELTCYPYNTNYESSILNVFVTNIKAITDMEVKQELSYDHVPIIATLTLPNSKQPYQKALLLTNWEDFENSFKNDYPEVTAHGIDINTEAKVITDTIKFYIKKA
ncbi:hypothetical protein PR048_028465 [Dryococelus australis]|uniref:Endonuclease/exonuclease/phosphatase domain-containing protein n=1 Tax=Dryococelus australis TaxID=614101 RepID=A0ABQ9GEE9_9NEOP|nr:hypothetical protein PR048_028465 [Dryococelus australis]